MATIAGMTVSNEEILAEARRIQAETGKKVSNAARPKATTAPTSASFEDDIPEAASDPDSDGTASIDKTGAVSLLFQPVSWKAGKKAKSVRGSGEKGEVICDGLYNGRPCRFYVRGWLANPTK